ncbi:2-phospho-L-lactate guanylyltransferase [Nitratireductor pacificus]|uniref:3-phospho-D-glycerate guanylyltransferase n=1 Tax=Nitratireductor pacificus pht-3B TaxID=391937 RepID=K2MU13_9HYPH|nr:2-phospho-L-lactate guanylyltransferase [Nitratireductor pacificus]EKF20892.1 2-phospho-L-lactate guanylyltransferase CofC [Nitratireductor pacificus pht-3B]
MSGYWAIVPVKRLDRAKSRLSLLLSRAERQELAGAMLRDVFDVLVGAERLSGIVVVTNDVQAAELASGIGASVVPDRLEAGTNEAVRQGLEWLLGRDCEGAIVVPGDVPFASPAEVDAVAGALDAHAVVLVPALRDGGTNMLGLRPSNLMEPAFGPDSFTRHLAMARAAGITPRVLHLEGAGHDIDVSSDLFCSAEGGAAARTRAFLERLAQNNPVPATAWLKEELQP